LCELIFDADQYPFGNEAQVSFLARQMYTYVILLTRFSDSIFSPGDLQSIRLTAYQGPLLPLNQSSTFPRCDP
jgi:hypothetical protein